VLAGSLAQWLGGGHRAAATSIGILGCASLAVTVALIPGLRRSQPRNPAPVAADELGGAPAS